MFKLLLPKLSERDKRLAAAAEALALGYGGITLVYKATGIARTIITAGIYELKEQSVVEGRIRREGAGRKPLSSQQMGLVKTLKKIAKFSGNPESSFLHYPYGILDMIRLCRPFMEALAAAVRQ